MQLADRVAVITGGGRGIGKAIALAFAREGAHVAVIARTRREVEETAQEASALGREALAVQADVSVPHEAQEAIASALGRFGRVDVLVNNAGIYGPIGPLQDNDTQEWLRAIAVNLGGVFLCTQAVLSSMVSRRRGKIINISGGGAASVRPNFTAYTASKAAVVRLTECLAAELAPSNIQLNTVAPGGIYSGLIEAVLAAGDRAGAAALSEARRIKGQDGAVLDDLTALATFLASDASGGLTGRLISAIWDEWRTIPLRLEVIMNSDLYTVRRVVAPTAEK